ncbi:MAG: signal recognition particle protein [Ignavibacteria bacterium]
MFEDLTAKFETVLKKIRGQGKITERNVEESLREVRRILFDADVNYRVVNDFITKVKEKSLGQEVLRSITPGQLMVKIINDELIKLMGAEKSDLEFSKDIPSKILVVGLQGSGKTTFAAKLARFIKKKGRNPLLVACDVYRPAAIEQLKLLGSQIEVPVFSVESEKDVRKIATDAIDYARKNIRDTVIVDTAGRLAIDQQMMNEVAALKNLLNPSEILFVVDSMTGQDAVNTARAFFEKLEYTGIVLTKLDGDTKGGAALSIRAVVERPIKFISTGEKLDAIDQFHPDRMASRILGMGDVVSLVEKAQEEFDAEEAIKLQEKLRKNKFDFNDLLAQLRQVKKMGSISNLASMIPGMGTAVRNLSSIDEDKALKKTEAIILSMTKEERENPQILNGMRRRRIANGSGTSIQEVNRLIKQYEDMRKIFSKMGKGKNIKNILRGMGFPNPGR